MLSRKGSCERHKTVREQSCCSSSLLVIPLFRQSTWHNVMPQLMHKISWIFRLQRQRACKRVGASVACTNPTTSPVVLPGLLLAGKMVGKHAAAGWTQPPGLALLQQWASYNLACRSVVKGVCCWYSGRPTTVVTVLVAWGVPRMHEKNAQLYISDTNFTDSRRP
jgi:hypothetical protein